MVWWKHEKFKTWDKNKRKEVVCTQNTGIPNTWYSKTANGAADVKEKRVKRGN